MNDFSSLQGVTYIYLLETTSVTNKCKFVCRYWKNHLKSEDNLDKNVLLRCPLFKIGFFYLYFNIFYHISSYNSKNVFKKS